MKKHLYKQLAMLGVFAVIAVIALVFKNTAHGGEVVLTKEAAIEQSDTSKVSAEMLAVIRQDLKGGQDWGAGVDVGYKFNKFVSGHALAVGYANDDWGGSAVDEVAALVEARLFTSDNGGVTLSAIGGGVYSFDITDFALGIGGKAELKLTKRISGVASCLYRVFIDAEDDAQILLGAKYSF